MRSSRVTHGEKVAVGLHAVGISMMMWGIIMFSNMVTRGVHFGWPLTIVVNVLGLLALTTSFYLFDENTGGSSMHTEAHPDAGKTFQVTTASPMFNQETTTMVYTVEDWWDHLTGNSWRVASSGNPAAINYFRRATRVDNLPLNDEVVYGHSADGLGHLVHVTELKPLPVPEPGKGANEE